MNILLERPITEKPKKEGVYVVKTDTGRFEANWNEQYGFHMEFTDCSGVTHWYEPITLPDDTIIAQ